MRDSRTTLDGHVASAHLRRDHTARLLKSERVQTRAEKTLSHLPQRSTARSLDGPIVMSRFHPRRVRRDA
jgi:hypothetical protein